MRKIYPPNHAVRDAERAKRDAIGKDPANVAKTQVSGLMVVSAKMRVTEGKVDMVVIWVFLSRKPRPKYFNRRNLPLLALSLSTSQILFRLHRPKIRVRSERSECSSKRLFLDLILRFPLEVHLISLLFYTLESFLP